MGLIQPLEWPPTEDNWNSWMTSLTTWAQGMDQVTSGLPVTKQGITNLMEASGSTSNAMLMYYVTALPPAGSFADQVVFNGKDGRIYVWNGSQWEPTGATAFDQLTGFLQAGQLLLGNQINICTNGCVTNDTPGQTASGWSTNSSFSNAPVVVNTAAQAVAGCPTENCLYIQGRDTYFTAGNGFDVAPGDQYYLEAYMGSDGTTPGMQVGLYFPAVGANGPTWLGAIQAPSGLNGWVSTNGVVTVPSWANRAMVWLQVNSMSATASAYGNNWFTGVECVKSMSSLQQYTTVNVGCPYNTETSILTGSFFTGYASILMVQGDFTIASSSLNIDLKIYIDGSLAVSRNMNTTYGASVASASCDIMDIVTTYGSHTFDVRVTNNVNATPANYQIQRMFVLNLLK